jgi:hypothetical protein
MTDFSATSNVLVQYGADYLTAVFSSVPVLHSGGSGARGGFALNGQLVRGSISLPQVGDLTYQLEAVTNPGFAFTDWTVQNPGKAWVENLAAPITSIQMNGTTTLTAHFVRSSVLDPVEFVAHGGAILFDGNLSFLGTSTDSVTPGTYYLAEASGPGRTFEGWTTTGGVSVGTAYVLAEGTIADVENLAGTWTAWYNLTVSGAGSITARFVPVTHPVTFIDFPFDPHVSITISGAGMTRVLDAGATTHLASGIYTLTLAGGTIPGLRWFGNSNLTFAPDRGTTTTLSITGSGTIYAVGGPTASPTVSHEGVLNPRSPGLTSASGSPITCPGVGRWV